MLRKLLFPVFIIIIFLVVTLCFAEGDTNSSKGSVVSVSLDPGVEVPIGLNSSYFGIGGSLTVKAGFSPSPVPFLSLLGEFFYLLNPYGSEQFLSGYGGGGGFGLNINAGEKLKFLGFATVGYSFCSLDLAEQTSTGGGTYISGGLEGDFYFSPLVAMGMKLSYRNILGVYSGLSASIGASLNFDIKPKTAPSMGPVQGDFINLLELNFARVFPVFYSYYDENSMGTAVLFNNQEESVSDIEVSLLVNKYMDTPKHCVSISELPAGESKRIDLKALFTENMLEITEGMKVSAEVIIDYKYSDNQYRDIHTASMQIEFRNAMTWDDDRKAAAFVTAKDPDILSTSKNIAGIINEVNEYNVNRNLLMAMAFHETLRLYGLSYVIDPSTPYENLSEDELRVDYLQFPRETLEYRAGDCDDLSILYCALFESVGIETAFITVPGHIYMAFSLGLPPDEAKKIFVNEDALIFYDEKTWIPVEITTLEDDFLKAWQLGAKQWREYNPERKAGFFQIHEAWEIYRPIGLPGRGVQLVMPSEEMVSSKLIAQVKTFVEREIFPQVSRIETKIAETSGIQQIRNMNKLGVLFARYGLTEKAMQEFNKVILLEDFIPSFINIGNIYFMEDEMTQALPYYEKALKLDPDNKKAILHVATVNHELENYSVVNELYSKLKTIDADFAEEFAYLDLGGEEGTRASQNSRREAVLWED